jgi:hypothetical protein
MKINMLLKAPLVNGRRHLVFPCVLLAAALTVGTGDIATMTRRY